MLVQKMSKHSWSKNLADQKYLAPKNMFDSHGLQDYWGKETIKTPPSKFLNLRKVMADI